jgi:hypothetical protein
MNQFTMLNGGNENAPNALFAGHEIVTICPVILKFGMKMS